MNWYKNYIIASKTKQSDRTTGFYPVKASGGKEYIIFHREKHNGIPYRHMTINPISAGEVSRLNYVDIYVREFNRNNLTNANSKQGKALLESLNPKVEKKEPVQKIEQPESKPEPKQMEFNFASKRSRLLHRKARVNKIKGGLGDDLEVKDVDKDQLTMGIAVELEHVGKGVNISDELISKFVENELQGINEHLPNQEILEKSQDIVMDHLIEIDDYYTRLDAMEKEAKEKSDEKKETPNVPDNTERTDS